MQKQVGKASTNLKVYLYFFASILFVVIGLCYYLVPMYIMLCTNIEISITKLDTNVLKTIYTLHTESYINIDSHSN